MSEDVYRDHKWLVVRAYHPRQEVELPWMVVSARYKNTPSRPYRINHFRTWWEAYTFAREKAREKKLDDMIQSFSHKPKTYKPGVERLFRRLSVEIKK